MLNPDLPIYKAEEDRLNRARFAKELVGALNRTWFSTSFTIGLYGPWGSGKTSLLNMIVDEIEENHLDIIVFRFNPWLCSDEHELITQFMKQLANAIKKSDNSALSDLYESIVKYGDLFDPFVKFLPSLFAFEGGEAISGFWKGVKSKIDQREADVQTIKDNIIKILNKKECKVLVTIDDIDRLSDEEIISVFKLVKSVGDFPSMIYLLAFDFDIVVRALKNVQHGDGSEYLEKIIQVPFEIPSVNLRSIHIELYKRLEELTHEYNYEIYNNDERSYFDLIEYGVGNYINSFRDLNRFFNVLILKASLLRSEVNLVDLMGITCLQVFEPIAFSKLKYCKSLFTGQVNYYFASHLDETRNAIKEKVREICKIDSNKRPETISMILAILFPKVDDAMGKYCCRYTTVDSNIGLKNRKIYIEECFNRYFSFSIGGSTLRNSDIKYLIYHARESEVMDVIAQLFKEKKLNIFMREIHGYAQTENQISDTRAKLLLRSLCRCWNYPTAEDGSYEFRIDNNTVLVNCLMSLSKRINSSNFGDFFQDLFEDEMVEPSILALLLKEFEDQYKSFNSENGNKAYQLYEEGFLDKLKAKYKARCIKAVDTGRILIKHGGVHALIYLGEIDNVLKFELIDKIIKDDNLFIDMVSRRVTKASNGTVRIVWLGDLRTLIDDQEACKRAKIICSTEEFFMRSESVQGDIAAFLIAVESPEGATRGDISVPEGRIQAKLRLIKQENHERNSISTGEADE